MTRPMTMASIVSMNSAQPYDPTDPEDWTVDQCRDEAEECLGHTEDETYLEACGNDPFPAVCVNEESCPQWIFEDPTRTLFGMGEVAEKLHGP